MVIYEKQEDGTIKAYSNNNKMIKGGVPNGIYAEAIDPEYLHRTYTETDIDIPVEESK